MADQFHNVGKDVIEAFLQGAAIRQRKEEGEQRAMMQIEQAKLAQKRIDMSLAQFQERMEETKRVHDSEIKVRELGQKLTDAKIADLEFKLLKGGSQAISDGLLEPDPDGPPGALRRTAKGQAIMTRAENLRVLNVPKLDYNKALGQDKLTNDLVRYGAQAANAVDLQGRRIVASAEQGNLNRANKIDVANIAAGSSDKRLAATQAKEDKKVEDYQSMLENNKPAVMSWDRGPIAKIAGGALGTKMFGDYQKAGIKLPAKEHLDWMEQGAGNYANFIREVVEMNKLIEAIPKTKSDTEKARMVFRVKQLRENQEKNLEQIAKTVKDVKGVLTNEDVARQWSNFPELLPGGLVATLLEGNVKINRKRVNEAIDMYERRMRILTDGMRPEQFSLIKNKFGILSPDELRAMRPGAPEKVNKPVPRSAFEPEDITGKPGFTIKR